MHNSLNQNSLSLLPLLQLVPGFGKSLYLLSQLLAGDPTSSLALLNISFSSIMSLCTMCASEWFTLLYTAGLEKITMFWIYIRISHFLLGYCSYNYHNYVNNLAEQVCNLAEQVCNLAEQVCQALLFNCLFKSNKQ